jgi:chemotaxis protein methyltransferase CheR
LRLLIEAIYLKYSYDFRDYSGASIKRRVTHALRQFECATISALQERCCTIRRRSCSCCSA